MRRSASSYGSIRAFVCLVVCLFAAGAGAGSSADDGGLGSPSSTPGLVGTCGDGQRAAVVHAATPDFYLEPGESLHPALEPAFTVEWTGFISILEGGRYEFQSGDAELHLGGRRLTGAVRLDSGRYPVRILYRRPPGAARLELRWRSDHFAEEPVPSSAFFHAGEDEALREQAKVERGRFLIEEYGCINCHVTDSPSLAARRGPDLSRVGARATRSWIYHWLGDPTRFRAGAVMPAMLDEAGRRNVAAYLATLGSGGRGESRAASPHEVGKGRELYESIGCHACHDLPELSLAGMGSKTSIAALAAYLMDPGEIDPGGRMPSLLLSEQEAWSLAAYLVQSRRAEFETEMPDPSEADPEDGKRLVRARGCLACHELETPDEPGPLVSVFGAPPLARLRSAGGCLAIEPAPALPRYRLEDEARIALGAFIDSYRKAPDVSAAPVHTTARRLEQLRCTACHQRDARGPSVPILDRVPTLTGIGAKLKSTWIDEVLVNRRRVRPELHLRMPDYPASLVRPLPAGLAASAGIAPAPIDDVPRRRGAPGELTAREAVGADMIGSDGSRGGLSCLACHDHGDFRTVADEKGPQMIGTAERLRFDWFRRWMQNPGRIISGTSMPTYFSGLPAEEADEAIARLWAALSLGSDMPRPFGAGIELLAPGGETFPAPVHTAVVVRFPLPGATAAAIAVGLPRQGKSPAISYCFDAAVCRLVYAWQGGFLDLSGSLGKQMEHPRLLGEIFYRTGDFPLRIGEEERVPTRRFHGYRIVDGSPEFRYEADRIDIRERILPARSADGFVHEFRIERVDGRMWFVVDDSQPVRCTSTVGEFRLSRDGRHRALAIPRGRDVRFDVGVIRSEPDEPDEATGER